MRKRLQRLRDTPGESGEDRVVISRQSEPDTRCVRALRGCDVSQRLGEQRISESQRFQRQRIQPAKVRSQPCSSATDVTNRCYEVSWQLALDVEAPLRSST